MIRRRSRIGVTLICLLFVLSAVSPPVGAAADGVLISDFTHGDENTIETREDATYVWQSTPHSFTATLSTTGGEGQYTACLRVNPQNGRAQQLTCQPVNLSTEEQQVTFEVESWPENATGPQDVELVVRADSSDGEVAIRSILPLHVLTKDGDLDGDGLPNGREVELGADFDHPDTDGDGLEDGVEVDAHESDPTTPDTDGDGLDDGSEVNRHQTEPTITDSDEDGLNDSVEVNDDVSSAIKADTDGDGLDDGKEVNTHETDPNASDTDDDGLSDAAEVNEYETNPTKADTDDDGLADGKEVNVHETDPTKADTDGDGLDDGVEINKHQTEPTKKDTDGDGLEDGAEVNRHGTNPNNKDSDGDGLTDGAEVNRYNTKPLASDSDEDGTPDSAEVDRPPFRVKPAEVLGASVVVVLALGVVFLYRTERLGGLSAGAVVPDVPEEGDAGGAVSESPVQEGGQNAPEPEPPQMPLTDEDRILSILDEYDGRIRQTGIVEETGWSKSKVSRVLSEMEETGMITKINVGRENIITRPGDEPEITRGSFENQD